MRNKNLLFHKALLFSLAMLLSGYTTKAEELIATAPFNLIEQNNPEQLLVTLTRDASTLDDDFIFDLELKASNDDTPLRICFGENTSIEVGINSDETTRFLFDTDESGNTYMSQEDGPVFDQNNEPVDRLTEIKIYGNPTDIATLSCRNGDLSSIDISNNSNLEVLDCSHNLIQKLNVSNNLRLTSLNCSFNRLTQLDISPNVGLTNLSFYRNQIESIDLSQNIALTNLRCGHNNLSDLDLSNNNLLTLVQCENNHLKLSTIYPLLQKPGCTVYYPDQTIILADSYQVNETIDLSSEASFNNSDTFFYWYNNGVRLEEGVDYSFDNGQTTFLRNITGEINAQLINLLFGRQGIETSSFSLTEQNNPEQLLVTLTRDSSTLDQDFNFSLGVAANKANSSIRICFGENTSIETSITDELSTYLFRTNDTGTTFLLQEGGEQIVQDGENPTNITEIKIYGNPNDFSRIFCRQGSFSSIDVSNATNLEYLDCEHNNLENIDITNNPLLNTLFCSNNRLAQLDLDQNRELAVLACSHNNLETISIDQNTKLEKLYCDNNDITQLSVENNDLLRVVDCRYNHMPFSVIYPILQKPELGCSYDYQTIILKETYRKGETIDFSTEQSFGGYPTYVTWYSNDEVLREGVDYIFENGETTFIRHIQGTLRATLFNYYFRQQKQILTTTFDMPISTSLPEWESNNRQVFGAEKQIVVKGLERNTKIQIFNTIGVQVRSLNTNQNDITIPVPHAGIYLLRIQEKVKGNSYKVIVQ